MTQKNVDHYFYDYDNYNYGQRQDKISGANNRLINNKKSKTNLSLVNFLFLIAVIFVGSIVSLRTFCLVKSKSNEIIVLQEKLKAIKSENKILEEELSKKFDLSTVKEVAEKKLGMHEPFGYQVVKIKLPKLNYVIKYKR